MAQRRSKESESAAQTLDELEGMGDKIASWIATNPVIVLGSMAAILVVAGIWGLVVSGQQEAREASSAAFSQTLADYRRAMGGTSGQLDLPEPANPEIAAETRRDFVAKLATVAEEHEGTAAGALAALEAGNLQSELGDDGDAVETWTQAAASSEGAVRAIVLQRLAAAHEEAERWTEAAAAYEQAAEIPQNPVGRDALAHAARCRLAAGEPDAALALYDRLEADADASPIDGHIAHTLRELRESSGPAGS